MTMSTEADRFNFLIDRDGLEAALAFAETTYKSYRLAVLRDGKRTLPTKAVGARHFASLPHYRRTYIESYLYLKNKVLISHIV